MAKNYVKLNKKKVINAIEGSMGNKTIIQQRLGCTWVGLYYFLKRNPELLKVIEKEKEKVVDLAENKLVKTLSEGDIKDKTTMDAILKVLNSRIAYGTGWEERTEIINKNLNVNMDLNEQIKNIVLKVRNGDGQ